MVVPRGGITRSRGGVSRDCSSHAVSWQSWTPETAPETTKPAEAGFVV